MVMGQAGWLQSVPQGSDLVPVVGISLREKSLYPRLNGLLLCQGYAGAQVRWALFPEGGEPDPYSRYGEHGLELWPMIFLESLPAPRIVSPPRHSGSYRVGPPQSCRVNWLGTCPGCSRPPHMASGSKLINRYQRGSMCS